MLDILAVITHHHPFTGTFLPSMLAPQQCLMLTFVHRLIKESYDDEDNEL